ncbi:protein-glutamate O-methyltransferase CheR [Cohnella endophytica]|uniref:protein-glutamate O-methyltransferase n=1 Tax=Cohnella endophytica TaxID=2419778 RepID=A0A494XFU0_9BACL|nr:protein-glutamate O-methyltransferase CheR [Cohnella endophytica]RKP47396.1 protein-glutamate O-methyltransferase CheR [Cohnella endophytica]
MIAITDEEFRQFSHFIKDRYGIHLRDEKKALLAGRLQQVLAEQRFGNFTEYYRHVVSDASGAATALLADKITTNHTFFMRESSHFQFLKDRVLPRLALTVRDRDLRIWSAGCSSGEEPYTLAFMLDELFGSGAPAWDTRVLATDISSQALATAVQGTYSDTSLESIPSAWRSAYFRKTSEGCSVVSDKIKSAVIFRKFNLMQPTFPFRRKFHVIFCRNVMIYFDERTKRDLVRKFYENTEPGGYLFIGHSESLEREGTGYKYVMPSVYRKDE